MNPVPFRTHLHIAWQRTLRWEFWPWRVVYLPIAVYWFFLALKARGLVFFSAANPSMRFGGFVAYSKWNVLKMVPEELLPKTVYIKDRERPTFVLEQVGTKQMQFPLIIKPDVGERGKGVHIIYDKQQLEASLTKVSEPMLLQEFEDRPLELGVMYSRHPEEQQGRITSIVQKEFPKVIGDGERNLLQLILSNERTRFNYKVLLKAFGSQLDTVPEKGEEIPLVKLGNHILGATFLDANELISEKLEKLFDDVASRMDGFHFGRFDIRTASGEALREGDFKIIEVNGANSEPAHIYDPQHSVFFAWKVLFKHWKRLASISIANHQNGTSYASFSDIINALKNR